jgi:uncharacterized membrane protein YhhN
MAVAAATAEDTNGRLARLLKMAASSATILFLVATSSEATAYMWLLLAALALSWIGDLALTFDGRRPFIVGLVSFAVAHVVYAAAFVVRGGVDLPILALAGAVMVGFAVAVLKWLAPHRPAELRRPIMAYVVIISLMVTMAFASQGDSLDPRIPLGAVVFAASDILVAREQFVARTRWNRIIGLPLYFAAQLLLASTA